MNNKYLIHTELIELCTLEIGSVFHTDECNSDSEWIYKITQKSQGTIRVKVVQSPKEYLVGQYTILPEYLAVYSISYLH